ncbi:hypothetical protein fugu_008742 [Takifugu bimaculatus]|uniref:Uncharacterized protein n=1 Tax=Takifugu bimaculatus TaxID=433685 RepID=A0A4Z2AWT0_9TELE|nr:hypothetical protein fugu_008742 [Takifugu bimaculatus]
MICTINVQTWPFRNLFRNLLQPHKEKGFKETKPKYGTITSTSSRQTHLRAPEAQKEPAGLEDSIIRTPPRTAAAPARDPPPSRGGACPSAATHQHTSVLQHKQQAAASPQPGEAQVATGPPPPAGTRTLRHMAAMNTCTTQREGIQLLIRRYIQSSKINMW